MAKVTWLGVEGDDTKEVGVFNRTFKKGEAVEVDDPAVLQRCWGSIYFKVDGWEPGQPEPEVKPPSQQPMAGAVPKGGEPIKPLMPGPAPRANPTLSSSSKS